MDVMRNEIGSEFWEVPTSPIQNDLFDEQVRWFLSGRSALTHILAEIGQKTSGRKAALPAWCCDSMIRPFLDAGFSVSFYPVYHEHGQLVQDLSVVDGCDVLLMLDYFGYVEEEKIQLNGMIRIRDLTHSALTQKYTDADYYFGSLRKWAGFWTGGFAYGCEPCDLPQDSGYIALRKQAMEEKEQYLSRKVEGKGYLDIFDQAEEHLENCALAGAAKRDIALAECLDVDFIKKVRRENATRLLEEFADIALFPKLGENDCPLFVPILVPDGRRDALRDHLIAQQIYCPVHWPLTKWHQPDERSMQIYENELSLVCDQRYMLEDMERMIKEVKAFWKE